MKTDFIKNNYTLIIGIIILAVLGVLAYSRSKRDNGSVLSVSPVISDSSSIEPIELSPTPAPSADVLDGNIYKNEKYGYEIKYPLAWFAYDDYYNGEKHPENLYIQNFLRPAEGGFSGIGGAGCRLSVWVESDKYSSIQKWIDAQKNNLGKDFEKVTTKEVELGGVKGLAVIFFGSFLGSGKSDIVIFKNGVIYKIIQSWQDFPQKDCQPLFDQILSTFKFTEVNDASGWKTYKNEKYGYEVRYPGEWRVAAEYMKTMAEISSDPEYTPAEDYFVVLTRLSSAEEKDFLEYAKKERGIALTPYFDFGLGKTITIVPVFGNKEDLYKEINNTITIKSSNIRDVVLSGKTVTRYRRYEATDNGVFDFESALVPYDNINDLATSYDKKKYNYIEVKIERNNGNFEENVFDQILSTLKFTGKDANNKNYNLDCTDKPDSFLEKYFWYKHFKEQIIENWSLSAICYNDELNNVAYLKSKIDWKNYAYDANRTSYGLSQLGIYDIEKDKYDKAPEVNLGFYEGCGIIKEWNKNNEIIYQCGSGDAGVGNTRTFSYNIFTKTIRLTEECSIQAGRKPEEICTEK